MLRRAPHPPPPFPPFGTDTYREKEEKRCLALKPRFVITQMHTTLHTHTHTLKYYQD